MLDGDVIVIEAASPARKCQERSYLTGHGNAASPALDLFDSAPGPKFECPVDHTKVMKAEPTQEKAE